MTDRKQTGWWTSLRGRLIVLALVAFVPLFGLSVYRAIDAREQALAEARATVERLARDVESELAAHLQGTRHLTHAMGANPVLRGSDFAACSAVLAAQLKLGKRYAAFVVAGRDGKLLCSSDPTAAPVNYADREHFRRVLETRRVVVGKPIIGRVAKRVIVAVDEPLLDANGEVQRVLLAGLDLAWSGAEIAGGPQSENLVIALSDEEGRVLYRQPDNDKWVGRLDPAAPINEALRTRRPGEAFESVGFEGIPRIFAFAHARDYAKGSLLIRVGATRDALTAAANRAFAVTFAVLIVIVGLVLFAMVTIAEKFVRAPVARLAGAAARLGEGQLSERVSEGEFRGELAELAAGFNRMAGALQAQMARAEAVVEAAPDPIVIVDRAGRVAIVNARTEAAFDYSRAELIGQPVELLIPQRLHAKHVAQRAPYQEKPLARAMGVGRELFARRKDGSEFAVEISLSPLATPEGTLVISTVRDVTERREQRLKIARLSRIHAVLSGINSAIVRIRDRQELFNEACRIAIEHGNFGIAWIGMLDRKTLEIVPVACAGVEAESFIATSPNSASSNTPLGQGIVGRALREKRAVYSNEISAERSQGGARRQEAIRRGYRSLISFPLLVEDEVVGSLSLFAKEPDFFDEEEIKLLTELAGDISFALENMAKQQQFEKLSRIRMVSSEINVAIVHIHDREALLRETCRIAAEHGKFELVWVALLDEEKKQVNPVAWAGFSPEAANAVTWATISSAKGSLGEAIQTRKAAVRNDMGVELISGKLRQEALNKGCLSTVCMPLVVDDSVLALIVFFAAGRGFFDEDELALLDELTADVSFALLSISRQEKLEYLSYYDALTGLPNRQLFVDRLSQQMRARSSEPRMVAVILLDIERLRIVNETMGRHGGDELLRLVSRRLEHAFHGTDYIARIGADGFGVVIRGIRDTAEIAHAVESQVLACFREPFRVNDKELRVAAKTGIAMFPTDGGDADTLFKNAEAALRKAKESGERFLFYTAEMNAQAAQSLSLETRLRKAVEAQQFVLHYQPKVDLASGRVCGLEALLRWNHPETGLVPPGSFIPLLEETGLILEVGQWVLVQALADYRAWKARGCTVPRIAVNVSAIQLQQSNFVDTVTRAVREAGDIPHALELEITESLLMKDIEASIRKLSALRELGIHVAMDDFGTGYSSLSYLARLSIDMLKIDRSFINGMTGDGDDTTIVSTIITLAHSLNLRVVAEGVETEEQAQLLKLLKCDEMQGYLFSRPLPAAEVEAKFLGAAAAT